jgi:beta-glucuronidase
MNNGLEQLREMIAAARNHPCIFSWGLCNEVNGQNPAAAAFVRRMYKEAKAIDPGRLLTYASHSLFKTPERDVAGEMDYVMFNEYFGSWQKGGADDLARTLDAIHQAFPEKAVVISEYGYCACTAERPENDRIRTGVLIDHDKVFRDRPWVAGLIFFSYNDYRTHIGDKGAGALKQRVHGVVDLFGARKPSWDALRRESSPVAALSAGPEEVVLSTRDTVPAYTLRGYKLRVVGYGDGDIPVERVLSVLPDLAPGTRSVIPVRMAASVDRIVSDVLRPSGVSVATAVWRRSGT